MTVDLLEQRLRSMEVETPDAGRVTAKVLAGKPRRRAWRAPRLVTVPAALAVLVVLVAYFVPAADLAIADKSPWSAEILQHAGLVGAKERITFVGEASTSSGYTVELVGAYADASRTVLLIHSHPSLSLIEDPLQITDQFGRAYRFLNGFSNSQTGDAVLQFEPLAWPDQTTGARITLHMSEVGTADAPYTPTQGSWTLTAAVRVDEAVGLPKPAGATLGLAHFEFASVTYTPTSIVIDIDVTGIDMSDIHQVLPDGGKGTPIFDIQLRDPNGQNVDVAADLNGPDEVVRKSGGVHVHFVGYRTRSGAYTLVVRYGTDQFERTLTIPS